VGQAKKGGMGATPEGAISIASSKQMQSGAPQYLYSRRLAGDKMTGKRRSSQAALDPVTQSEILAVFGKPDSEFESLGPVQPSGSAAYMLNKLKAARETARVAKQDVREARSGLRAAAERGNIGAASDKFQQARETLRSARKERNSARAAYDSAVNATQSNPPQ